jgi:hypothetical protein
MSLRPSIGHQSFCSHYCYVQSRLGIPLSEEKKIEIVEMILKPKTSNWVGDSAVSRATGATIHQVRRIREKLQVFNEKR